MIKIILLITLLINLSCSKQDGSSNKIIENISDEVFFEAQSIRTSLIDGVNTIPNSNLDFATLSVGQKGIQDLIITNNELSPLSFSPEDISGDIAPFIMTDTCSGQSLIRNRSCKLSFSITNNPNNIQRDVVKSLIIKGSIIQLTAVLSADLTPPNSPIDGVIVSPNVLNFGTMKSGQTKELSVIVSNRTKSSQTIANPTISNQNISLTSNTCAQPSVLRVRSCTMKFSYTAQSDETVNLQDFAIIGNNSIKHSVSVSTATLNNPEILLINPTISSSSVSLTEPQIHTGVLNFINSDTNSLPAPVQAVATPSNGVTINSVSCASGFSRNRTCSVSYSLNSELLTEGTSQVEIKLQSGNLASNTHAINLNVTKLIVACSASDAQMNGWNISNYSTIVGMKIGSDVSQCNVETCNQYYSLNQLNKSCEIDSCTLENAQSFGVNLLGVTAVSGNTPDCYVSSCNETTHSLVGINQKSCGIVSFQPQYSEYSQCSAPNPCDGIGTRTSSIIACQKLVNGQAVAGGTLADCSSFTQELSQSCNSPSGEKNISILNGSKIVSCLEGSSTENLVSITCNSILREPNQDNSACIDKDPQALTIDFENEYTNQITNRIIASSENAQEVKIYSQSSCIGSFTTYQLPLSQDITYIGPTGIVSYSAKFINGTVESSCVEFSYTYDTLAEGNLILTGLPPATINNINTQSLQLSSSGDLIGAKIILSNTACSSLLISDFDSQPLISLTNNYQITPILNSVTNFCAIGVDRANNWQTSISNLGSMNTDLVPPTNIISVTHSSYFNSTTQTPLISWTPSSDSLSGLNRYEISIGTEANLQDVLAWTSVNNATTYQGNLNLLAYTEDILYANIRAIDNAGNISAVKVSSGWYVGQPIVDLSITYPTSSDRIKISNASSFRVAGICSEKNLPVQITLGNIAPVETNCETNPADEEGLGFYEAFINASTLADGNVSLTVSHSNLLPYTRTLNVSLVKDTVAPIVSITSPANNSSYEILNNRNFTFTGTCSDSSVPVTVTSSVDINRSVSCAANQTFSLVVDLSDFNITSLSFSFRQTDLAGNLSNVVSITLRKGIFNRVLSAELSQVDYPNSTISTLLGTNTGKVAHLISANNDSEGALAISNSDGSEYIVLTPAIGNAGVSVFSSYQGQENDRLAVFNPNTETIYFRQRIPNSNAVGIYSVSLDGSNYQPVIVGENATHTDWEVVQFSLTQNRDKFIYISDEEVDDVYELYSMNLDGSGRIKLNTTLSAGGNVVSFYKIPISGSNFERVLYYADQLSDNRFDLFLANISGANITGSTKVVQVTPSLDSYNLGEVRDVLRLRITPNGQYVVFSHAKKALDATTGAKYYSLFSTYLQGTTTTATIYSISNTAAGRELYNYGAWHVSPNGTRIAYVDDTVADGDFHVYTCTITGASDIRITPDFTTTSRDYVYVRWHNDTILFMMGDVGTTDGYPNIYRADGTKAYNASNGYRALTNITASYSQVLYTLPTYYSNGVEMEQSNSFRTTSDGKLLFVCDLSTSTASQNQLCYINNATTTTSAAITSLSTTTHRVNPAPTNITTDVPAFVVSPTTPSRVTYLFDATIDGMYEMYVSTLGTTTNLKISNPIDYSAGSVNVTNNYFSVDWINNVAVYSANDNNPNRYAFISKLDGTQNIKIGELINVSDVEATMVVGNKIVFLADLDVPNQSNLYSANSDGSNLQKINFALGSNATILNNFKRVGNTNKIVYIATSATDRASELRMINLDTNVDTLLSTGSQLNTEIERFEFTRDLNYVVYIADRATDEINELWASKLDGTGSPIRLNPSGWATGQDVAAFSIAPDSNTIAVLHDSLNTDNKWVYHITKILSPPPTTWVNVTANSTAVTSASYIAVAPAVFNSNSTTVCFSGDLVTNSDFDLFCSSVTGSPSTTPIVGNGETDAIRNIVSGSLLTNPARDRIIYKGNMTSDSQYNYYAIPFTGGTARTLTLTNGNNNQIPYSNTAIDIIGVNQERFSMFYGDNFIFRSDSEVDEKFELYMSSVVASTTTSLKLNQALDNSNDVYSYLIIGDKVSYLADVGMLPRLLYSTNLTGTPTQTLLTSFDNADGNVLSFYPAGDLNSTYIGINATGTSSDVVDCYLAKIDGSNFRKLSPNLSPDTVGCERALVDNSELNLLFQADVFNFGVLDLFKQ